MIPLKFRLLLFVYLISSSQAVFSQDNELENLLDADIKTEYVRNAFKSSRVINAHSIEMLGNGVLDFRILHRFGLINGGLRELFGLDQATMRFGFDYAPHKNLTFGVGRSTFLKEYDGFVKYRFMHQQKGKHPKPLSLVWVSGITVSTVKINNYILNTMTNRVGYYHQLIAGRKFSNAFSLQLAPTMVHRNLVETPQDYNTTFALGIGSRLKVSNRVALLLDAFPQVYGVRSALQQIPLSIGVDIETGGHVFQLHVSNARGMNEKAFITETFQQWQKGEINFGFNLSRVFTIKKNQSSSW